MDRVKKEAVAENVKFGKRFRRSTLFLIRWKYPNLDFFYLDFTIIKGHHIPDLDDEVPKVVKVDIKGADQDLTENANASKDAFVISNELSAPPTTESIVNNNPSAP